MPIFNHLQNTFIPPLWFLQLCDVFLHLLIFKQLGMVHYCSLLRRETQTGWYQGHSYSVVDRNLNTSSLMPGPHSFVYITVVFKWRRWTHDLCGSSVTNMFASNVSLWGSALRELGGQGENPVWGSQNNNYNKWRGTILKMADCAKNAGCVRKTETHCEVPSYLQIWD